MTHTRRRLLSVFPLVILGLFVAGCPKRPASITVTASSPGAPAPALPATAPPAPTTPPALATPPAPVALAPAPPVPEPTSPAPAEATPLPTPPPPKEFADVEALKNIHFDFDKHDIRPDDAKILDENVGWMKANPDYLVLIEGHCDERGTSEYNLALGERRAKATMSYLISQGVEASRFMLLSYGKERPLCTEKNEECWVQNRRAHFLVKGR